MSDGIGKNWEVVKQELHYCWAQLKATARRLRKPSLDPRDREHFVPHVIVAMLNDCFDELPRTLTYATLLWLGWGLLSVFL